MTDTLAQADNTSAPRHRSLAARIAPSLVLAAIVLLALGIYSDFDKLLAALRQFNAIYVLPALGLALCNYLLRFVRWHYYLRETDLDVPLGRSASVFFSGLAMSITPGKVGELLKSFMLKEEEGIPISKTAPVVVAERYTDLLAVMLLVAVGAASYPAGRILSVAGLAVCALLLVLFTRSGGLAERISHGLSRRWMKGLTPDATREATETLKTVLKGRPLAVGAVLGIIAWLAECMAFYVVVRGFGWQDLSMPAATFVYASATAIGAVSMLPGGLGVTEGTMAALLVALHLPKQISTGATLIVRACTLWFAVLVGLVFYGFNRTIARKAMDDVDDEVAAEQYGTAGRES